MPQLQEKILNIVLFFFFQAHFISLDTVFVVGEGVWNNFKIHLLPFEFLRVTVAVGEEKHLMGRQQKESQD